VWSCTAFRAVALEFAGILEDHDSLGRVPEPDHLGDQGIGERGLAGGRPPRNHEVLARPDGRAKELGLRGIEDLGPHVVLQRIRAPSKS